ncbi:MAG TPA: AMIN domain-containing protein [Acidiferrobacteraceae bacterium]|nr:AMIN domain-containing protein [Acidiferrobacteraceae bacterium]
MKLLRTVSILGLVAFPLLGYAQVAVKNLRMWRAPDHTRLVFDLSRPITHRLFSLSDPHRIVIDMENAVLRSELPKVDAKQDAILRGVRSGRPDGKTLRIVLDLHKEVRPKTFVLKPNKRYGHRLVIDLYPKAKRRPKLIPKPPHKTHGTLIVAVDAGHGGDDFGAVGHRGTVEKEAVLKIARYLKGYINAEPGMRAVMIRNGDYYISLYKRTTKARRHHADLFVSIHADYFPKRGVRGASVYALSQRGATSSQAKILADKENAADLFGGVRLSDKDDDLARLLLDLAMTQTISDSLEFGNDMLRTLKRSGPIHLPNVEQAGFAVLKTPDMPSILVETAFISNPKDEKRLRSATEQRHIAHSIFRGIKRYAVKGKIKKIMVAKKPKKKIKKRVGKKGKQRQHIVKRGDTLSEIAVQYGITLKALRKANGITGHIVRIGKRLRIPAGRKGG